MYEKSIKKNIYKLQLQELKATTTTTTTWKIMNNVK